MLRLIFVKWLNVSLISFSITGVKVITKKLLKKQQRIS